ncbi:MAG: trans-splicing intein-formed DNA polymerase III subunit alpha C-terminal partner DnaE-C, partial [Cyanobacteria bacterium P01_D01_bin.115]
YERIGHYIQPDARLMVWGKYDRRDDQVQFIVDDAEPIEEVRMVMVELDPQIADDIQQRLRLKNIIQSHQGDSQDHANVPVIAIIGKANQRQLVRLGAQFRVKDPEAAINALARADFKAHMSPLISA